MGWSDITGSDYFQAGYPLVNALLAASGNRGANAAYGLNVGMGVANRFSEQRKRDEQDALLRQKLGDIFKATTPVTSTQTVASQPVNPNTAEYSMPDEQPNTTQSWRNAMAPASVPLQKQTTVSQQPLFNLAQQKLGAALSEANRPDLALGVAERALSRQPQAPHTFGNAELGMFRLDENGQPVPLVPGVGRRESTPPRPVIATQGGEGVQSVYNKDTGQWETQRQPLTAAPARELSPQDQRLKDLQANLTIARTGEAGAATRTQNARTGEISARTERLKKLTDMANDPNASQEKLTTVRQGLLREKKIIEDSVEYDSPENVQRLADINILLDDSRRRLAEMVRRGGGGGQQSGAAPQTPSDKPRLKFDAQGNPVKAIPPNWKAIGKDPKSGKIVYEDPSQIDPRTGKPRRYVAN